MRAVRLHRYHEAPSIDEIPEPERSRPPLTLVPAAESGTGATDVTPDITSDISAEAGAPDGSAEAEPPEHGDGPAPLVAAARMTDVPAGTVTGMPSTSTVTEVEDVEAGVPKSGSFKIVTGCPSLG